MKPRGSARAARTRARKSRGRPGRMLRPALSSRRWSAPPRRTAWNVNPSPDRRSRSRSSRRCARVATSSSGSSPTSIAFDTTARLPGDPARDETACQNYLRDLLAPLGGEADLWEPEPVGLQHPLLPDGLDFAGRPQLAVRLRGEGGGRSLLLNGHIDAVSAEPMTQWTSDPFKAEIRDGQLYGRGSCDMKGGIADSLFALLVLRRLGRTPGRGRRLLHQHRRGVERRRLVRVRRAWREGGRRHSAPSRPSSTPGSPAAGRSTRPSPIEGRTGHAEMVASGLARRRSGERDREALHRPRCAAQRA